MNFEIGLFIWSTGYVAGILYMIACRWYFETVVYPISGPKYEKKLRDGLVKQ